jgi:hypothetical protein
MEMAGSTVARPVGSRVYTGHQLPPGVRRRDP